MPRVYCNLSAGHRYALHSRHPSQTRSRIDPGKAMHSTIIKSSLYGNSLLFNAEMRAQKKNTEIYIRHRRLMPECPFIVFSSLYQLFPCPCPIVKHIKIATPIFPQMQHGLGQSPLYAQAKRFVCLIGQDGSDEVCKIIVLAQSTKPCLAQGKETYQCS